MTTTQGQRRSYRDQWLAAVAKRLAPWFAELGHPLPKYKASIGFTSKGARSSRIGECWDRGASTGDKFEIFISPTLDDPTAVAAILAHELVHAAVGLSCGHRGAFRKVALAIGLEGKMKAAKAGPRFLERVAPILATVGPLPHARLSDACFSSGPKKQTTRLIKCECGECGYVARVTAKWLREAGAPICPAHMAPMSHPELGDDDEDGGDGDGGE
jgi:hypothetical protein